NATCGGSTPARGGLTNALRLAPASGRSWSSRTSTTSRTRYTTTPESPGLDRLLEVKQTAAAELQPPRATRRDDEPPPARPLPPPPPPRSPPPPPPAAEEPGDYLDRLRKAKERGRKDDE
ncbi:MAG TPA: hypothetical protein VM529_01745, partial [Gemmata sp.]|nr:hypothetical protein [Gemmata sp.]